MAGLIWLWQGQPKQAPRRGGRSWRDLHQQRVEPRPGPSPLLRLAILAAGAQASGLDAKPTRSGD